MAATPATFEFDVRTSGLAQTLCEQLQVPVEITDMISLYFEKQNLLNICLLSSKLHAQANAIIYYDVSLDFGPAEAADLTGSLTSVLFFRTLVTSKTAARDVRRLSFLGDPLSHWREDNRQLDLSETHYRALTPPATFLDLSSWTLDEVQLYSDKIGGSSPATGRLLEEKKCSLSRFCLDTVSLVTELQHLQITSDYFRYPGFRSGLKDIAMSRGLEKLESCDLCSDLVQSNQRHMAAVSGWDDALLTPFLAPKTTSIRVAMALQPQVMSQLPISSLTSLVLRHYQEDDTYSLDTLLAATPHLRYLEYHAWVEYSKYRSFDQIDIATPLGLEPLFDALKHVNGSLECLDASVRIIEDSPHWSWGLVPLYDRPFRLSDELFNLRRLTKLSIPYASLLGWERRERQRWDWDWDKLLPASLRDITWTDHLTELFDDDEDWSDESLLPVISSLITWLAERGSGNEELKFGLFLPRSQDEFNEPIRKAITQFCEQHGIICKIEKRCPDWPKEIRGPDLPPRGSRGRYRGRQGRRGRLGGRGAN